MRKRMKKPKGTREQYFSPSQGHFREIRIEAVAAFDESSRSVQLSFSSAEPLQQYDWWTDGWYKEILDHSEGAIRLKRLQEIGVALFNHNCDYVIGRLKNVTLDAKTQRCSAQVVFDSDTDAEKIYQKVKSGTLKGVSVGFRVYVWEEIAVDGISKEGIEGPAMIARDWEPYEVSIVSFPADTTVGVGRSIKERTDTEVDWKEKVMELFRQVTAGTMKRSVFDKKMKTLLSELEAEEAPEGARFVRDLREASGMRSKDDGDDGEKSPDDDDDDDEGRDGEGDGEKDPDDEDDKKDDDERKIRKERCRAAEISAICLRYGVSAENTSDYINRGFSVGKVNMEILRAMSKQKGALSLGPSVSGGVDERDKFRSAVRDGLRIRAGHAVQTPAAGADDFRGMRMISLASLCLERAGASVSYRDNELDIARRAFSTSDFPAIMSNLADVTLVEAYKEAEGTWRQWCGIGNATDFKEMHKVRMGEMPLLEPVLEGGEYKMADLVDTKDSFAIGTFGKKFSLTRQAIINDDLGAFIRIPSLFGSASARTINTAVYKLLISNPVLAEDGKAVFHVDHGNLSNPASALSTKALSVARIAMRRQKGLRKGKDEVNLNIAPKFLIIPPELEALANQILYSETDVTQANPAVKNPVKGFVTPIVEAELAGWGWFLAAAASMIDTVEVAFLSGQQSPTVESQPGWDVDGMDFKVRLDFGAWLYDYRGLYKNAGADPAA